MSIIIYFDMETGGVQPTHPTIQLAAIAQDGGVELGAFEQKIAFNEADADPEALRINHYTREGWVNAVAPSIAASRFAAWLRPYCWIQKMSKAGNPYRVALLAGYNALTFDYPRLKEMFGAQFLPCDYLVRDVLQRVLFHFDEEPNIPRPDNFKLSTVAQHFGVDIVGAHDALADVRMTAAVHEALRAD